MTIARGQEQRGKKSRKSEEGKQWDWLFVEEHECCGNAMWGFNCEEKERDI